MFSAMTEWQLWHRAAHASTASAALRAAGLTEEPVVRGSSTTISVNWPYDCFIRARLPCTGWQTGEMYAVAWSSDGQQLIVIKTVLPYARHESELLLFDVSTVVAAS